LAVVGSCLGVYVVLAMAFNWFVEPTVAKSREVAALKPPPGYSVTSSAAPSARSELPSRVVLKPTASAADATEKAVDEVPRKTREYVAQTTAETLEFSRLRQWLVNAFDDTTADHRFHC
jgi:hypothetical protein